MNLLRAGVDLVEDRVGRKRVGAKMYAKGRMQWVVFNTGNGPISFIEGEERTGGRKPFSIRVLHVICTLPVRRRS